jgi:DNA-binding transcriptional MerR regulator
MEAGVRPSALRYYEAQGILRPAGRRPNGYRVYTGEAVKFLLFVRRAQALGMSLKEIKPLVDLALQGEAPCGRVKTLARRHLREIDERIARLRSVRNDLRAILRRRPGRPDPERVCPIVEQATRSRKEARQGSLPSLRPR